MRELAVIASRVAPSPVQQRQPPALSPQAEEGKKEAGISMLLYSTANLQFERTGAAQDEPLCMLRDGFAA